MVRITSGSKERSSTALPCLDEVYFVKHTTICHAMIVSTIMNICMFSSYAQYVFSLESNIRGRSGGGGGLSEFETFVMGLFIPVHAPFNPPPLDLPLLG